jgi:Domain of unknown function (DUF5602)
MLASRLLFAVAALTASAQIVELSGRVAAARTSSAGNELRETRTSTRRHDGAAQKVGDGTARAYIVVDESTNAPVEVGVALSEAAMEGLPAPMPKEHMVMTGAAHDMHNWILELPSRNPTPYKFVQFGWNPQGHEPEGVWDTPHFDFHFYTVPIAVRNSIVPSDPQFAEKAARYPAPKQRAPFYLDAAAAAKATPAAMTVPEMGLHWIDARTPEIQAMAGNPQGYKPFTKTFIYGSWNGEFIFAEPMITRAYLLEKRAGTSGRDEDITVPQAIFAQPGYYPASYRITYDAKAREYRIALTQFWKRA